MANDKTRIFKALSGAVGAEHASIDAEVLYSYSRDTISPLTGDFAPDYVVRPGNRDEVQRVVRIAAENKIPMYTINGGTNQCGMALANAGGIQVDMRRMNRIIEISEESMAATFEPAVRWRELDTEANKKGLYLDLPMAPYSGTPVGSWLSWNVSIYMGFGPTDKVLSLEVVLPNGEILTTGSSAYAPHESLNPYLREAYGPDLTGLFRGSYGAFGIVTKVTMALHPLYEVQSRIDIGHEDIESAVNTLQNIARWNFQRFIVMYNRQMMTKCCAPDLSKLENDKKEHKRVSGLFPEYFISVGLNGVAKQVDLYKEMISELVVRNRGTILDPDNFEQQVKDNMDDFLPGAGKRTIRMMAPWNKCIVPNGFIPLHRIPAATHAVMQILEEMGYADLISGESASTMYTNPVTQHGRMAYLEFPLLYNPQVTETIQKVGEIGQRCLEVMRDKYGMSSNIYFPGYTPPLNPEYDALLKGIKKYFDPQEIMAPGKLVVDGEALKLI